jgi:hypothetical protein
MTSNTAKTKFLEFTKTLEDPVYVQAAYMIKFSSELISLKVGWNAVEYQSLLDSLDFELEKSIPSIYGTIWLSDGNWALCENDEWKRYGAPKIPKHLMR